MGTDDVEGALKPSRILMDVSHLLLYEEEEKDIGFYFCVSNPSVMPEMYGFDKMKELNYPFRINRFPTNSYERRLLNAYGKRAYLVYDFDTLPIDLPMNKKVNLRSLLDKYIGEKTPLGQPFVISFNELLRFIG